MVSHVLPFKGHFGFSATLCSFRAANLQPLDHAWAPASPLSRQVSGVILRQHRQLLYAVNKTVEEAKALGSWKDVFEDDDVMGPAFKATLVMLEWPRLCKHVSAFASTTIGRAAVQALGIPATQLETEDLVAETAATIVMEGEYAAALDFGGINTSVAQVAIGRASRGGLLSGQQLVAVASLVHGGGKLRSSIAAVLKQAEGDARPEALQPLADSIKGVVVDRGVAAAIDGAIREDGGVRDSASDGVRRARSRVTTLQGRLRGILQNQPGEVTEQGGRVCIAVPGNDANPPRGILLASDAGVSYIEPAAAMDANNELAAARGEVAAAEEAVLWNVTSQVIEASDSLSQLLDMVIRLDVACARSRYSAWIDGCLPTFVPFAFASRGRKTGASGKKLRAQGGQPIRHSSSASVDEEPELFFQMMRLRHPLLLGDWLTSQDVSQRSGQSSISGASRKSVAPAASKEKAKSRRRLSNRKEDADVIPLEGADPDGESGSSGPISPVPVDICVKPEVRSVIITGPNTGGKTAALKAVGLAVLMARVGLAVPAQRPVRLPPFPQVLADLGDEQSLSASLSTFSGHLKRIQALRGEAAGKALVLLDEVGTGTEPVEGAALGIALLRALADGGRGGAAITMSTTHHSALTSLKYEDSRFENVSMEFDESAMAPTYRLLWGIPGRSNALNIAQRLGLDASVIDDARGRLGAAEGVNEAIGDLETLRRTTENDQGATAEWQSEASLLTAEASQLRREIADIKARCDADAAAEVFRAARDVRSRITAMGKEQSAAAKQQAAADAKQSAIELDQRQVEQQLADVWLPHVGETVYVPSLKGRGQVTGVKKKKKLVSVKAGLLSMTVKLEEIRRL